MKSDIEPIHRWDGPIVLKAFLIGALLEAVAIAPAILSPWGHAGPESIWGWLGLLLNAPGLTLVWLGRTMTASSQSMSAASVIAYVYLIQTLIFSYVAFLWLRWRKRRVAVS